MVLTKIVWQDKVKTLRQLSSEPISTFGMLSKVFKNEGVSGLYAG